MNKRLDDTRLRGLLALYLPEPSSSHAEQRAYQAIVALPRCHQKRGHFILSQVGFIRKRTWALQLLLFIAFITWISRQGAILAENGAICILCACMAPLLVLINVGDFARIYHGGMLEVELATRYSLPKVIAARMLIFGIVDMLLLVAEAAVGAQVSQTALTVLLLYCLTPFCFVCVICMELLRRMNPTQFTQAILVSIGILVLFLIFPMGRWQTQGTHWLSKIYSAEGRRYWIGILAGSILILCWQFVRFNKENFDFLER